MSWASCLLYLLLSEQGNSSIFSLLLVLRSETSLLDSAFTSSVLALLANCHAEQRFTLTNKLSPPSLRLPDARESQRYHDSQDASLAIRVCLTPPWR
jgi:hypothetical protein